MAKFTLEIELGNDAMTTRSHVAKKLREVARDITKFQEEKSFSVRDENGNRVGRWTFSGG